MKSEPFDNETLSKTARSKASEETFGGLVDSPRDPRPGRLEGAAVRVTPTQIRKPWRSTARTIFQALIALAVLFPILVETAGLDPASAPWLVLPLAIAAALARIMALPQVEVFLRRFVPFLSATGKQ